MVSASGGRVIAGTAEQVPVTTANHEWLLDGFILKMVGTNLEITSPVRWEYDANAMRLITTPTRPGFKKVIIENFTEGNYPSRLMSCAWLAEEILTKFQREICNCHHA